MSPPPGIPPALQSRAADRPPRQERWGTGATLSAIAHVALVAGLAWSVHWKTDTSEAVEAELWAAVPEAAAPPPTAVETPPAPVPPQPQPRPEPAPPPPPPAPTPPAPRPPDIVTERDAKARERERQREERERQEELQKQQKQQQLRDEQLKREQQQQQQQQQVKQDKLDKQKALDQKKAEDARLKKLHDEEMARMMGGLDAPATATGTARRSAGPSAGYGAKVRAVIHPFIRPLNEYPANLKAEILVTLAPDGSIAASRLEKSSGDKAWDDEALKSIERARAAGVHIPRDIDGSLPNPQIMLIDPGS